MMSCLAPALTSSLSQDIGLQRVFRVREPTQMTDQPRSLHGHVGSGLCHTCKVRHPGQRGQIWPSLPHPSTCSFFRRGPTLGGRLAGQGSQGMLPWSPGSYAECVHASDDSLCLAVVALGVTTTSAEWWHQGMQL